MAAVMCANFVAAALVTSGISGIRLHHARLQHLEPNSSLQYLQANFVKRLVKMKDAGLDCVFNVMH